MNRLFPQALWQRRLIAVLLLILALSCVYSWLLQPLLFTPWQTAAQQRMQLSQRYQRYQHILAHRDEFLKQLQALKQAEPSAHYFLTGDDPNLAASQLIASLQRQVNQFSHKYGACEVKQSLPFIGKETSEATAPQLIRVSLSLACEIRPLTAWLHSLEQSQPLLVIDSIEIHRRENAPSTGPAGPLEVSLLIQGYLAPSGGSGGTH